MNKEHRVRKNEEFQQIIRCKQSFANSSFVVYYKKNTEHLRVGISVSKKLGNAVVRNRVKRQVRMMVSSKFDMNKKCDYIIIVRNKFLKSSFDENLKQLEYIYNKINKRME